MRNKKLSKLVCVPLICLMPCLVSSCATLFVGAAAAGGTAAITSDPRDIDTMAIDDRIEQASSDIFKSNKILSNQENFSVSVTSMFGNVLLTGQTTQTQYLNWAISEIKKLDGVRKVYNYVENRKPLSASEVANDAYITSKIKTKHLFAEGIKSNNYKVVTDDARVFIMGYVTRAESKKAVDWALTVEGIKKIYTIFEYYEGRDPLPARSNDTIKVQAVPATQTNNNQVVIDPVTTTPTQSYDTNIVDNGGAMIVDDSEQALEVY